MSTIDANFLPIPENVQHVADQDNGQLDCCAPSKYIFSDSVFQLAREEYTSNEVLQPKNISSIDTIRRGIYDGLHYVAKGSYIGVLATLVTNDIFERKNTIASPKDIPISYVSVHGPLMEELKYRVLLHEGIFLAQWACKQMTPSSIKSNRVFSWLSSASFRMLLANTIFAAAHLSNAGGFMSTASTVTQVSVIFFYPTLALLYETDGVLASLVSHMTSNFILSLPLLFSNDTSC